MFVCNDVKFRPGWKVPSLVMVARCTSTQRFSVTVNRVLLLSR